MRKFFLSILAIAALAAFSTDVNAQLNHKFTKVYRVPNNNKKESLPDDSLLFRRPTPKPTASNRISLKEWCRQNNVADNLEAAFTLGTGGLGLELATPITKWTRLRAGVEWIPSFHLPLSFEISSFNEGNVNNDISHIQDMVYEMTGLHMDDEVKMIAKPKMLNFKLLVDVFPFQNNRHWHFTAGFYAGNSIIGRAENKRNQMPTLVALNLYNRAYDYFTTIEDIYDVPIGGGNYLDPDKVLELQEKFREYGRAGIHIGDFKNGEPYIMQPAQDGKVRAKAKTNPFKPYLGFGYSGALDKEQRWNIGVEAGVLFWGGAPQVILHDGVNMNKDLVNVRGKVGDYLNVMKALPVYPLINFKISYSFF